MSPAPAHAGALPQQELASERVQLCAFRVGAEEYVIDIMRIREIVPPQKVTPVPRAPDFIEGVVNLRGAIVPVVDLRKRLGLPPVPAGRSTKFLIVLVARKLVGLVVDQVCEVVRLSRGEIKAAPGLPGSGPRIFVGVCGPPERLRLLLDIKALLSSTEPVPPRPVPLAGEP